MSNKNLYGRQFNTINNWKKENENKHDSGS
jgi:hypothetical protein